MIHVSLCFHDKTGRYSKFAGTTLLSLFENTNSEVTVHLLHDNTLSTDNRDKFNYLTGQYNQHIEFYNVDELCKEKINEIKDILSNIFKSTFSVAAMYRFLIPELFLSKTEKIIYLDSDLIINLDIKELWKIELNEHPLAAVPEIFNENDTQKFFLIVADGKVNAEDYFNSGVLLMNAKFFQDESKHIKEGMKFISGNPRYHFYMDQDILNYLFAARALKLPVKFNRFAYAAGLKDNSAVEKNIYHYVPKPQALGLDMNFALNRLWMKYFMKTPWFNEDTIGRLYSGVQQLHIELKQSMVNLSAMMSGKTRTFFAPPRDIDGLKKFFSIRDDEEIILAENQESLQKLIDAMKNSQGKKVFFIMLPAFPFQALIQAGFVPNKDFVNGLEFLSEAQGLPLNSYQFIKTM